jgi:hypothetical protein
MTGPILIREATDSDHAALVRLAERDSATRPPAPVLVAFRRGEAHAAISLSTGAVIADPFHRTAELVRLLQLRAAQLVELEHPRRGRGLKLRRRRRGVVSRPRRPRAAEAC